jgi:hypothetical protein
MIDLPKALQHLAELQAESPYAGGTFAKRKHEEDMIRALSDPLESSVRWSGFWRAALKEFPKEFSRTSSAVPENQSVIDFQIMRKFKKDFDKIIRESFRDSYRYNISEKVYFGTLESSILNAIIKPVPESDEYLIIINRALWESLVAWSYIVVSSLEHEAILPKFAASRASRCIEIFDQLLQMVLLHRQADSIFHFKDHLDELGNTRWEILDGTIHAFVLGHEYAHFLHNHFQNAARTQPAVIGSKEYRYSVTAWSNEYQADRTALDLVVFFSQQITPEEAKDFPGPEYRAVVMNSGILFAVQGCLTFLYYLCSLEALKGVVYTPESSHPPTWLRIVAMWGVLGSQIPDAGTIQFFQRMMTPILECIDFFIKGEAHPIRLNIGARQFAERLFQDAVFQTLFHRTHYDAIVDLRLLYQATSNASSKVSSDRGSLSGPFLNELVKRYDLSLLERKEMIERCLAVLEKNAEVFHLRRPS